MNEEITSTMLDVIRIEERRHARRDAFTEAAEMLRRCLAEDKELGHAMAMSNAIDQLEARAKEGA